MKTRSIAELRIIRWSLALLSALMAVSALYQFHVGSIFVGVTLVLVEFSLLAWLNRVDDLIVKKQSEPLSLSTQNSKMSEISKTKIIAMKSFSAFFASIAGGLILYAFMRQDLDDLEDHFGIVLLGVSLLSSGFAFLWTQRKP